MIVCSCNVLSDHDVRSAVVAASDLAASDLATSDLPRNPKQIYGCLGCSAECGRCARTIKAIIDEALGPCAKACCSAARTAMIWRTNRPTSSRSPPPENF